MFKKIIINLNLAMMVIIMLTGCSEPDYSKYEEMRHNYNGEVIENLDEKEKKFEEENKDLNTLTVNNNYKDFNKEDVREKDYEEVENNEFANLEFDGRIKSYFEFTERQSSDQVILCFYSVGKSTNNLYAVKVGDYWDIRSSMHPDALIHSQDLAYLIDIAKSIRYNKPFGLDTLLMETGRYNYRESKLAAKIAAFVAAEGDTKRIANQLIYDQSFFGLDIGDPNLNSFVTEKKFNSEGNPFKETYKVAIYTGEEYATSIVVNYPVDLDMSYKTEIANDVINVKAGSIEFHKWGDFNSPLMIIEFTKNNNKWSIRSNSSKLDGGVVEDWDVKLNKNKYIEGFNPQLAAVKLFQDYYKTYYTHDFRYESNAFEQLIADLKKKYGYSFIPTKMYINNDDLTILNNEDKGIEGLMFSINDEWGDTGFYIVFKYTNNIFYYPYK